MSETLKEYQEATRELERIETQFKNGETDILTLNEARQRHHNASNAWNEERASLSQRASIVNTPAELVEKIKDSVAGDTIVYDEAPMIHSAPTESELSHTKRLIKECRKALYNAREANKDLYAQLAANRQTKRELNEEYTRLRARKKELETVST